MGDVETQNCRSRDLLTSSVLAARAPQSVLKTVSPKWSVTNGLGGRGLACGASRRASAALASN